MQRQILDCGAVAILTTETVLPKILEAVKTCPKVKVIVILLDFSFKIISLLDDCCDRKVPR